MLCSEVWTGRHTPSTEAGPVRGTRGDGRPRVPKATQGERTGVTRPEDRLARDGRGQLPRGVPRKRGERLRPDTVDQAQA